MKSFVLIALLALAPSFASGKCADSFYTLKGKVLLENGKPAVGAIVGASWIENNKPAGPAIGKSDSNGNYTIYLHFRKFTGIGQGGDECNGTLSEISIQAYTAKFQSIAFKHPIVPSDAKPIKIHTIRIDLRRDGL